MIELINDFFNNEIIRIWVAPIITGAGVLFIGYFANVIWKKRKVTKQLDVVRIAENKIIDMVRPFIIKELPISQEVIEDIRDSVIREFSIKEDEFMDLKDLKKSLIYDIVNTNYIDESTKAKLIEIIAERFSFLNITIEKEVNKDVALQRLKNQQSRLTDRIFIMTIISVLYICLFVVFFDVYAGKYFTRNLITYLTIFLSLILCILTLTSIILKKMKRTDR